jgi:hypothetical protein
MCRGRRSQNKVQEQEAIMTHSMDQTPRSNALFSAIVATVAASNGGRLTVREIASRVGTSEDVTASCIALHRYFRNHPDEGGSVGAIAFPAPADFKVPCVDDAIDERELGLVA